MLSAPQAEQIETYTLKQLNNVLNLAFHYIDFKTPLLFKTDPDDKLIASFKTKLLPLLDNCSISVDDLAFYVSSSDDLSSSNASGEQLDTLEPIVRYFIDRMNDWTEKQDSFNMSYLMTGLVKQVFKKCNLLDYSVNDYQLKIDLRANAIREQFYQFVLKKIAKNLAFDMDGNTPILFEEKSLSAILSERCFSVMIAELTQVEHFELAEALHNMLHLAKRCSMSSSAYNMSTFQLAATYSPCFLSAFSLEGNIYTKQNGFTSEECARIGRQWKLMTIILTHTLQSTCFDIPYASQESYYKTLDIPPLLLKEAPGLQNMIARTSHVTALDLIIHRHYLTYSELVLPSSSTASHDKKPSSKSGGFLSSFSRLAIRGKKHPKKDAESKTVESEAVESETGSAKVRHAPSLASIPTLYGFDSSSDDKAHSEHWPPPQVRTTFFSSRDSIKNRNISSPTQCIKLQKIPPLSLEKLGEPLSCSTSSQYQVFSKRVTSADPDISPGKSSGSAALKHAMSKSNSDQDRAEVSSLSTEKTKDINEGPRALKKCSY